MKKFILSALMLATTVLAQAQVLVGGTPFGSENEDLYDNNIYTAKTVVPEQNNHLMAELGFGDAFDFTFRWNHQFGSFKYVTWDVLNFGLTLDNDYEQELPLVEDMEAIFSLQTGVRYFSPTFVLGKVKAKAFLGGGFGVGIADVYDLEAYEDDYRYNSRYDDDEPDLEDYEEVDAYVAAYLTAGIQINRFCISYGLQEFDEGHGVSYFRLGLTF